MRPEFKEAVKIAATGEYKCIPVSLELYADQYTPLMVLRKLKNVSRHCYMLESAEDNQKWGRYTFLGYDPRLEITCTNGKLTIKNGTSVNMETKHPGEYIRQILDENKSPKIEGFPTFTGGLVGYFSYDYMKYAEPSLVLDAEDKEGFKDVDLMLFDKVIAFDHFRQKIILIVNIRCEDLKTEYHRAELELSTMRQLIQSGEMAEEIPGRCTSEFRALFEDAIDAVDSILPAGTLSGAPKIRACEIINELENNKRGIYGGAIGYLDFTGNLDTCIAIRIAYKKNGKVFVRSGAGIVADSVPQKEYQECINKAKAVMNALATAQGGIDQ